MYSDAKNLYGREMSQKLPVDSFKWITDTSIFDDEFIRNYNGDSNKGYIIEVDVEYPKELHDLHTGFPFLPDRIKINKCNKFVCNLYDKKNLCCSHKSFKRSIKSWPNTKKSS